MKRVIYIKDVLGNNCKYIFRREYRGWGIYQEKCPSGLFVSQSWATEKESNGILVEIQSFNRLCMDELLDSIDNYEDGGKMKLRAFNRGTYYCVHNNGNVII